MENNLPCINTVHTHRHTHNTHTHTLTTYVNSVTYLMRIRTEAFLYYSVDEIIPIFISFLPFAFAQLLFVLGHVWSHGGSTMPTTFHTHTHHAIVFHLVVTSEHLLYMVRRKKNNNKYFLHYKSCVEK